jgi:hypothetical protein
MLPSKAIYVHTVQTTYGAFISKKIEVVLNYLSFE